MDTLQSWASSLPPLREFIPPPSPDAYIVLLTIFSYFPIGTLIQWLTPFYPQGKTSLPTSRLNFPGRYAWALMESVCACNLLYSLHNGASNFGNDGISSLPTWHKVVAGLYVLHYLNRAIITPLFIAPSMSPIHISIIISAMLFNYLNSSCLAGWLLGYGTVVLGSTAPQEPAAEAAAGLNQTHPPSFSTKYFPASYIPYIGLCLFFLGMYGNIKAEGVLFRLRREEADKTPTTKNKQNKNTNKYSKIYILPAPTGYFRHILFPHYVLEWLEWFGFLLIGFSITSSSSSSSPTTTASVIPPTPPLALAPYYAPLAKFLLEKCSLPFPLPAIAFFVNVVATTAARASWGRAWYVERFGEEEVGGRGAFVPGCKWL
ncbi:hypothetical protein FQN51_005014 [Onygenales sp. PD_10]|nr:hypothetical protein FQN51_005014 [Onygenales sp. PD_10]